MKKVYKFTDPKRDGECVLVVIKNDIRKYIKPGICSRNYISFINHLPLDIYK